MTTSKEMPDMTLQESARRSAFVCGVLYLLTFVGSILAAILVDPVIADPAYVSGPGADSQLALGAVFELVNVLACFGTAVAVFSIVKLEHEGLEPLLGREIDPRRRASELLRLERLVFAPAEPVARSAAQEDNRVTLAREPLTGDVLVVLHQAHRRDGRRYRLVQV